MKTELFKDKLNNTRMFIGKHPITTERTRIVLEDFSHDTILLDLSANQMLELRDFVNERVRRLIFEGKMNEHLGD